MTTQVANTTKPEGARYNKACYVQLYFMDLASDN